jgi:putative flippase GtrA
MTLESVSPFILKFLKFVVVGASGLLIDFGLTYFFKEVVKWNKYVANSIGFFIAASSNFFINRIWTFSNQDPQLWLQYGKFIAFALIGLAINSIIIWFLHGQKKKNFYFSKGVATILVTGWNFLSNFFFTFR